MKTTPEEKILLKSMKEKIAQLKESCNLLQQQIVDKEDELKLIFSFIKARDRGATQLRSSKPTVRKTKESKNTPTITLIVLEFIKNAGKPISNKDIRNYLETIGIKQNVSQIGSIIKTLKLKGEIRKEKGSTRNCTWSAII